MNVRVMDPFTVKPLDGAGVQEHAAACGGRVVTVEDHYPEGGLGDAVLAALATCRNVVVRKLAVTGVPRYRVLNYNRHLPVFRPVTVPATCKFKCFISDFWIYTLIIVL